MKPYIVAVTPTDCTNDQVRLEGVTGVSFPSEYRCWASASDFRQRQIQMKMAITGNYSLSTNLVVRHLAEFASSAGTIDQHPTVCTDVIQTQGTMEKPSKYININVFAMRLKMPEVNSGVLMATSASDMGVDYPNAQFVLNCEFPEDLSIVIQITASYGVRRPQNGEAGLGGQR